MLQKTHKTKIMKEMELASGRINLARDEYRLGDVARSLADVNLAMESLKETREMILLDHPQGGAVLVGKQV